MRSFDQLSALDTLVLAWICLTSVVAFLLFAYDKFCAGRPGRRRVPELNLVLTAALGGWLGGVLAMLLLRHKTAKFSFILKYVGGFLIWAGLIYVWFIVR